MPENVANQPAQDDLSAIMDQALTETPSVKAATNNGDGEAVEEGKDNADDSDTAQGEELETPDEEKTGDDGATDEPEGKGDEEKPETKDDDSKAYKIGNREFSSVDDAMAEANRIVGRNAKLSGDLKKFQSEIKKLTEINEQWSGWAAKRTKGDPQESPEPEAIDPEMIAEKVIQKMETKKIDTESEKAMAKEVEELEALDNWDDVQEVVEKLSDKENPLTGKPFTPKEAYRMAVHELDLEDLTKKAKPAKDDPPKADKTKAGDDSAKKVRSAAARPNGGSAPTINKAEKRRDFIDAALDGV
jgi:hypothetical protein